MLAQFYLFARPSELPKVLFIVKGEDQGGGVFAVNGKTTRRSGEMPHDARD